MTSRTLHVGKAGSLVVASEIWSFSASKANGGYVILRNGEPAANGAGLVLNVANDRVYHQNNKGQWWVWGECRWFASVNPTAIKMPRRRPLSAALLAIFALLLVLAMVKMVPPQALYGAAVALLAGILLLISGVDGQ